MRINDFDIYKDLLKKESGLVITPDKSYLLDSRLTPVAKKWGHESLDALALALRGVPDPGLVKDIVEAMTTNETSFFRDSRPFDLFKDSIASYLQRMRASKRSIRIWCAACSSGQEPYSLVMLLKDMPALAGWNIEILATDISDEILEQAKKGTYSQFEVQRGLPIQLLMKYFEQQDDKWQLKGEVRNAVTFRNFNLLDNMSTLGAFDVIFCRNVLIYFDEEAKGDILDRMARCLPADGFLFLGGAETVLGISESYKPLPDHRGIYIQQNAEVNLSGEEETAAATG